MKQKREKIYDFGRLGKWSEGTLKEQLRFDFDDDEWEERWQIDFIEKEYRKTESKLLNQQIIQNSLKIRKIKTLGQLYEELRKLNGAAEELRKLNSNYANYRKIVHKLSMQRKCR